MRSRLAPILLALAGVVCAVALAEAFLRLRPDGEAGFRGLHRVEPGAPWLYRGRPGAEAGRRGGGVFYSLNEAGFRDRSRSRSREPGAWRIAVLGDSIAFGYGVDRDARFTEWLGRELHRAGHERAEVMNFAVSGYSPFNEAALFEGVVSEYDADLVLVQFCVNDLNDPTLHFDAQTRQSLGELPEQAFPDPATRGRVAPARRTWLAACTLRVCERLERALMGGKLDNENLALAMAPRGGLGAGPEREWLRRHYGAIATRAAASGARFGVVLFPHEAQSKDASDRLHRDLLELAAQEGWIAIDLLPAFREAARAAGEPLFLDFWHPSARGHEVAGAALARELERRGLVP